MSPSCNDQKAKRREVRCRYPSHLCVVVTERPGQHKERHCADETGHQGRRMHRRLEGGKEQEGA
jgi:hypothetical protein